MGNKMISSEDNVRWQIPAATLPDKKWDVAIIGAGPAGAIAALHLAAMNHQVLLLEKNRFPREKVCGDGLMQDALNCLDNAELGQSVLEHGHPVQDAAHTQRQVRDASELPLSGVSERRGARSRGGRARIVPGLTATATHSGPSRAGRPDRWRITQGSRFGID